MTQPTPSAPDLRVIQANERTLLAWVRTSLGIMAFGFVVARLGLWLAHVQPAAGQGSGSLWVGVTLVVFGSASLLVAGVRFVQAHRAIMADRSHVPSTTLGVFVAGALALGGLALAGYLASR
ncbi:MAG: YidH family protein [Planctomycetota bacterium]